MKQSSPGTLRSNFELVNNSNDLGMTLRSWGWGSWAAYCWFCFLHRLAQNFNPISGHPNRFHTCTQCLGANNWLKAPSWSNWRRFSLTNRQVAHPVEFVEPKWDRLSIPPWKAATLNSRHRQSPIYLLQMPFSWVCFVRPTEILHVTVHPPSGRFNGL